MSDDQEIKRGILFALGVIATTTLGTIGLVQTWREPDLFGGIVTMAAAVGVGVKTWGIRHYAEDVIVRHVAEKVAGPLEQDDLAPQKRRAIAERNAKQLQVTRAATAPPKPRDSFSHLECQLAGHTWMEAYIGFDRCSICGIKRAHVDRRTIEMGAAGIISGPTAARGLRLGDVNPAADRHVAFPEPAPVVIPRAQCKATGHLLSWGSSICVRCGEIADPLEGS